MTHPLWRPMCGLTPRRLCAGLRTGSRRGNVPKRPQAFSTTMPFRRQRLSLTTIGMSAPSAPPHKLRERFDCLGQRMIHRNAQSIGIHHVHDSSKFTPMRRAALLHIKLPLMNHLMGQGASYGCDRLTGQERSRETNDPPCAVPFFRRHASIAWPRAAHKQADRRRQAGTPLNFNRRQAIPEIGQVARVPD